MVDEWIRWDIVQQTPVNIEVWDKAVLGRNGEDQVHGDECVDHLIIVFRGWLRYWLIQ